MNRLDLIIDALENSEPTGTGWVHVHEQKHQAALAAAHELKALKPVGEFMIAADINGKNCYIQVEDKDTFTFTLYALDEVRNE
jgi:hypothetical protein